MTLEAQCEFRNHGDITRESLFSTSNMILVFS